MVSLDYNEYAEIAKEFERCNAIFQQFWEMGVPIFTDAIDTAEVRFDHEGNCVNFLFSKKFWDGLSYKQRAFIIAHECLHIVLNHGIRVRDTNVNDAAINNIAADIVVNHLLVDKLGMRREEVDPENKYCWIDTIFDAKEQVEHGRNMEYYINLLKSNSIDIGSQSLVDLHGGLTDIPNGQIVSSIGEKLTEETKAAIGEQLSPFVEKGKYDYDNKVCGHIAGTSPGSITQWMNTAPVAKKRKWETIIKNWAKSKIKNDLKLEEQWLRVSRRISCLNQGIILPSEMELEDLTEEKDKIDVWFFLDTSGSCTGYSKRFWEAAKSLPTKRFNLYLFCFDTRVYETSLSSGKLYGFGGTSFEIIENYIVQYIEKNHKKYPDSVFIITDGCGDFVRPKMPNRWHWFLTENYTHCIPKESKIYKLSDFE